VNRSIAYGERHPGPQDDASLRGGALERGSSAGRASTPGSPALPPNAPVTIGCSGVAEEGNLRNHPRSAGPSLGLPAHGIRATGSRCRKTSSRWMERLYRRRQAFTGESGAGVAFSEFVACGTSVLSCNERRKRGHHGAQHVKRVAAFVTLQGPSLAIVLVRRVLSCRSRQARFVGPIEALPPVLRPGRSKGRRRRERGPSPRRRTPRTPKKLERRRSQG